jgi:hypothetical protein
MLREQYLTIVYRLPEDATSEDVAKLTQHENVSAMAWGHILDEVHALRKKVGEE